MTGWSMRNVRWGISTRIFDSNDRIFRAVRAVTPLWLVKLPFLLF
jgi:hypothetical protein